MPDNLKLSVIIPVYNEERTILTIIERVEAVKLPQGIGKEILVIDDGSTDQTKTILKAIPARPDLKIFYHDKNQGKTAAVKLGIAKVTGDILVIQDADLEYNPQYFPALLQPILDGKATVVYGSRFMGKIQGMTFINRFANTISNLTINILYGSQITDFHTGYKMFRQEVIKNIPIESKNFTFDTEITAKIVRKGIRIYEIPIEYAARKSSEGKKITWGTAMESYLFLLRYRFSSS